MYSSESQKRDKGQSQERGQKVEDCRGEGEVGVHLITPRQGVRGRSHSFERN